MKERWTEILLNIADKCVTLLAALLPVMLLARVYEIAMGVLKFGGDFVDSSYLMQAIVNDFQFSVLLVPFIGILFLLIITVANKKMAEKVVAHVIAGIGLIQIALISYFGATQMPLGADFWAYTLTEMTNTVVAAEQISFWGIIALLATYILIYIGAVQIISRVGTRNSSMQVKIGVFTAVVVLLIGTFLLSGGAGATASEKENRANKLSYFIHQSIDTIEWKSNESTVKGSKEYPFLRKTDYQKDVLGPFFKDFEEPPNIVFLLVESLGGEFVGPSGQWTGFAPYLDSLAQQSLYWENGLSLSGRTFGMVPSLLGSLPFGEHGFMALGPNYPNHQSLISILDDRGYHTAFYSGYDTYFDGLNFFLDYQGIDYLLNKGKLESLLGDNRGESNYWGIDDKAMLSFAAGLLDTAQVFPRLEIYHTLQSHSPFTVPNQEKYQQQFKQRLNELSLSDDQKAAYSQYQDEFTTLLYADQAVQNFMQTYKQHPQFENTIFVITGDHWLIPVPQTSAISRYHVPIMIYSPKLKNSVHFKSVATHAEITPSILAFLDQQTSIDMPREVHWISGLMDTAKTFRSTPSVPLMRNKNRISDYLDGRSYLYGDELYQLGEGLTLSRKKDSGTREEVEKKLADFKSMNNYVVQNNKLYPGEGNRVLNEYDFLTKYDTLFSRLDSQSLSVDEQFERARKKAFNGDYGSARAIAQRILLENPNYHDVRILIGRTHAWQGNNNEAEKYFKEALDRDSTYVDTYNAYFDNEFWQEDYEKALEVISTGLEFHPNFKPFWERKIKVLGQLKNYQEAQEAFERLKKMDADYEKLPELKQYITE